jgi:hypothetical protein
MYSMLGKICTKCHKNKPYEEYSKDSRALDGKQSQCRECQVKANKIRQEKNTTLASPRILRTEKKCRICSEVKPANCFYEKKRNPDWLDDTCKDCHKTKGIAYRKRIKDNPVLYRRLARTCPGCNILKMAHEYRKDSSSPDGLDTTCRECVKDRQKWYYLGYHYDIDKETYQNMVANQNNRCAICNNEETAFDVRAGRTKKLAVDHNHETGKVRDLLCSRCNITLGRIECFENPMELLDSLRRYFLKHA